MKSFIILFIVMLSQHSLYFVVPCEATVTVRTYIFMKSVDSSTPSHSQTDVIETIQSSRSLLDCARDCRSHVGNKTCQNFHFHESTGKCELLESTEASRSSYLFRNIPEERTECNEPWMESYSNGVTEYVMAFSPEDQTVIDICMPIKMKVGRTVTFIGMSHKSQNNQKIRLERSSSGYPTVAFDMTATGGHGMLAIFFRISNMAQYAYLSNREEGEAFDVKLNYKTEDKVKIEIIGTVNEEFHTNSDIPGIDTITKDAVLDEIRIR